MLKNFKNEKIRNIKNIRILNLWVVRQFKGEYNPIHYVKVIYLVLVMSNYQKYDKK